MTEIIPTQEVDCDSDATIEDPGLTLEEIEVLKKYSPDTALQDYSTMDISTQHDSQMEEMHLANAGYQNLSAIEEDVFHEAMEVDALLYSDFPTMLNGTQVDDNRDHKSSVSSDATKAMLATGLRYARDTSDEGVYNLRAELQLTIERIEARKEEARVLINGWTEALKKHRQDNPGYAPPKRLNFHVDRALGEKLPHLNQPPTDEVQYASFGAQANDRQIRLRIEGLAHLTELYDEVLDNLRGAADDSTLLALRGEWEIGEAELLMEDISREIDLAKDVLKVLPIQIRSPPK